MARIFSDFICCVHLGRSGSTVLGETIKQSKDIYFLSEILHEYTEREFIFPWVWWRKIFFFRILWKIKSEKRRKKKKYCYIEIKMEPEHIGTILKMKPEQVIKFLIKIGFEKFIFLDRKNTLRIIVSNRIADQMGCWHVKSGENIENKKVSLPVSGKIYAGLSLSELLPRYEIWREQISRSIKNSDILKLTYEDDLQEDPLIAVKKVCDYFDIYFSEEFTISLKRVNAKLLKDTIENFTEVEIFLQDTDFQWMTRG